MLSGRVAVQWAAVQLSGEGEQNREMQKGDKSGRRQIYK